MSLLSVSLHAGHLVFDGAGVRTAMPLKNSRVSATVGHVGGNLLIQAENGRLTVGWETLKDMNPTTSVSTVYHRDGDVYRPELLIDLAGFVQVHETKTLHAEPY